MSDRLLSVTNGEAAYISDARWVSPAIVLFDEAVARAFEADNSRARLVTRGEALKAAMALRLEVRSFETDYVDGPKAPPEVLVEIRAVMTRSNDRALLGDKVFVARVKAADNRLSAIVPAYDQAVGQALSEIVAWVGERARSCRARLGDQLGHLRHGQVHLRRGAQQGQQTRQPAVARQAGAAQLLTQHGFHRMGHPTSSQGVRTVAVVGAP
jgi:hypothetical protein